MLPRKRLPEDMPQVIRLLEAAGLPPEGLERTEGWVIEGDGRLAGHVAVEPMPEALVLRSLVVDPALRGRGLGETLLSLAESQAAGRLLVLRTESIGPWVERRGYRQAALGQLPARVRSTTQFCGDLCASTPVYFKETTMNSQTSSHQDRSAEDIKAAVRDRYAGFVRRGQSCCGTSHSCGCSGGQGDASLKIGYAPGDAEAVPEGANLGLGCGNPVALASLKTGETVLDLGSGAGFDAFLAARRVGPGGRVIGVDMTPEMIERARALAEREGYANVEFRLGDIENLPVEDASVDAVISNCVINLTTDKGRAFREALRVLKPGGRLMVSDLVLLRPLPEGILKNMDAYAACLSGALRKEDYLAAIREAGFEAIEVVGESRYELEDPEAFVGTAGQDRGEGGEGPVPSAAELKAGMESVVSVKIGALRPAGQEKSGGCGCGRGCGCEG